METDQPTQETDAMFRQIKREEIERHLAAHTPITLVEALPEKYYRDGHLPGAINLPHDQVRGRVAEYVDGKKDWVEAGLALERSAAEKAA